MNDEFTKTTNKQGELVLLFYLFLQSYNVKQNKKQKMYEV
jgi:hypothetical protein